MSNKFTTPGGFAPTPSTCYPWPPWGPQSWPIPCLQGPVPSLVKVQIQIEIVQNIADATPAFVIVGTGGIASLTGGNDYTGLSINCPNGNLIDCFAELRCVELGAGGYAWQASMNGHWLNPKGHIVEFHCDLTEQFIQDLSQPGNYNLIIFNQQPTGNIMDNWLATNQSCVWYTVGAPL